VVVCFLSLARKLNSKIFSSGDFCTFKEYK
jgi:hypothetical protein